MKSIFPFLYDFAHSAPGLLSFSVDRKNSDCSGVYPIQAMWHEHLMLAVSPSPPSKTSASNNNVEEVYPKF